ncbi:MULTISPECIES: 6-phospho-alpha-glucosidase [Mammaliicoccus]|uniref:family 4 glycosyl hydrolase n=1 Tax=Mammaliicoccus TaxID=2803850 RepID=UPI000D1C4EED|nr:MULTISPECIES: 6-phospho-alpha-glucosidase [Mammaliicoccus]MEB8068513.1 6-phospho-alpha-glucosidase [Mammaliicoccus fleurettii]PTE33510.1 6-phospho-alpha-glucosidase [Mammaliicoccus fleurettii]
MKKCKLTIVGGGSTYTLGILMSLIEESENLPLSHITLYDTDSSRQEKIGQAASILLKEHYPSLEKFEYTTNKTLAFKDVDIIFVQIRTGGLLMRELDEQIPIQHGLVGQETCGAGGMSYGLRSISDMIQLVEDIRSINKDAWILNYTNPAAIVGLALDKVFPNDDRLLNICDMPIAIMKSYADILNEDVWNLEADYFGLNHFGWFTKIRNKDGHDYTSELKQLIQNNDFKPTDKLIANDPSWQSTFKQAKQMVMDFNEYLPNTYLQYYLYPNQLSQKESIENTRARQVINGREKEVFNDCDTIINQNNTHNIDISGDIHGIYMIRIAASLVYHLNKRFIIITRNDGIIPNLPSDALVEVPALLGNNGATPLHVGEISTFYKGLLENQYAYEKLVVEAYFENDYDKLIQALVLNRTVIDTNKAKDVLTDLFEANKDYWPNLNKKEENI